VRVDKFRVYGGLPNCERGPFFVSSYDRRDVADSHREGFDYEHVVSVGTASRTPNTAHPPQE